MSSIAISCLAFACVFGGALLGVVLRPALPKEHLTTETQDVVKLGMALIATMAALVLGLLIASAKSTYDTRNNQLLQVSTDIILLDGVLAHYGAETQDAREELRRSVATAINQFWSPNRDRSLIIDRRASSVEVLFDKVQQLAPQNEAQRSLQNQALTMVLDLARTRVLLFEQLSGSIPVPFLAVLVFWLAIIFASFGVFSPRNGTVIAAFFVCALSVSGAIFLILELDRSFEGMLQVSSAPLRGALSQIGR